MKFEHLVWTISGACLIALATSLSAFGGQQPSETPQEQALQSLVSTNSQTRLDAVVAFHDQRTELIEKLMQMVRSTTNSAEVQVYAVAVLGDLRAMEAVPFLVDHLDWDAKGLRGSLISGPGAQETARLVRPVSSALRLIGHPAVRFLLLKLEETDDTNIADKCVRICDRIDGTEVAKFRLEMLLKQTDDPKKQQRIQHALGLLR